MRNKIFLFKNMADFTSESESLLSKESKEYLEIPPDERPTKQQGMSITGGVFFIVGDIVGSGIVTLPYTLRLVGWLGIPLFFLAALLMCFCGILLSKGCVILFRDYTNREELRDPYPRLAEKSYGSFAKQGVTITLNVSLILTCIVFLLLIGEVFTQFAPLPTNQITPRNQLRMWFVICGVVILPLTLLGTPKDFVGIGLLATVCSALASVFILVNLAMTSHKYGYTIPTKVTFNPETLLAAFGTIQFTFGGVAIFPTIQNDLEEPEKFPIAVAIGYCIVFFIYTGVSLAAFIVLGDKIEEDLLASFTHLSLHRECRYFHAYVLIAQVLICAHVLCAFVMLVNPVSQQMEQLLKAPLNFCWQRVIIRSSIVILIVAIAVVIPNFGPVLSLAGGTLFSLLSVIFPIMFYCRLIKNISWLKQVSLASIIIIALASGFGNGYVELKNVLKVMQGKYIDG